jgi:hypothetical protein
VLSSGSDVAAASTVAPKMIPLNPSRRKNSSPLRSMTTPATSVAIAAIPNTNAAGGGGTHPLLAGRFFFLAAGVPAGFRLAIGCIAAFAPGQTVAGAVEQDQSDDPERRNDH